MNKGNLNKLVTNYPVELTEEEISNLSGTLAPVIAACGGGGGGTGGKIYTGIGFVSVNNTTNQIGLTNEANTKLNQDIPTKVSDLSDSANYQTVAGMDEYLTTANAQTLYQTKDNMSAYLTSANAQTLYQTKDDMSAYLTSANASSTYQTIAGMDEYATKDWTRHGFVTEQVLNDILQDYVDYPDLNSRLLNKQDKLTFAYDNDKISAINGSALAGQGCVTGDYYSASNPSGFINSTQAETQILEKHYLTEASGNSLYVPIPEGLSDGQYYAMTTSSWKVIQGAGDVSGISTVAHDDTLTGNGNNENLGVDTNVIQTKLTDPQIQNIADVTTLKTASSTWDKVSDKLDTTDFNTYTATTAPATYQPIGNYLSSNALDGYATTALLDTISSKIEQDIPTTVAQLTDSGNYYQKTDTSSKTEITNALNTKLDSTEAAQTYQTKGDYVKNTDISLDANNKITSISGKELIITAHQSLTNYYTKSETSGASELSTEFGKYALKSEIPTVPTKVSDLTDSANYYKTTETSSKNELSTEFAKYLTNSQYNTDSATFALKTDLNDLVSSASITTEADYVMTTTGWKVLTLPGGGMTQVIHDDTLTGDGNSNDNQLGVKWETLSSNTIAYSNSAFNLTNGTSVSSFNQISAAIDDRYSKSSSDGRYLQKSLDSTLTGEGKDNKKLGVAWSALSGNTIASAEKAGEAQGFRWGDNTYQDTSAALTNLWNSKNHVTLQTANNILTVDNNDNTSATLSAMSYVVNPNNAYWKPQRSCVCTEAEISTMAGYANGQGMLFFVVSGHN